MNTARDFYGDEIAELIEQACRTLGHPREHLAIEVVEAGSTGILGLGKKKAHIRVRVKEGLAETANLNSPPPRPPRKRLKKAERLALSAAEQAAADQASPASLAFLEDRLTRILDLMGLPAAVRVSVRDSVVHFDITGPHAAAIAGQEGKIIENLQHLLRRMAGAALPDRFCLALDAAGYRARRLAALREQALALAEEVRRAERKKGSLAGLNPEEVQALLELLQGESGIHVRAAGPGAIRKVLITRPETEAIDSASGDRSRAGATGDLD